MTNTILLQLVLMWVALVLLCFALSRPSKTRAADLPKAERPGVLRVPAPRGALHMSIAEKAGMGKRS